MLGAQRFEHRFRLQAFTHRRRMHPDQRAARIPLRRRPRSKTGGQSSPPVQSACQFLIESRNQRSGTRRHVDAKAVQQGWSFHLGGGLCFAAARTA